MHNPLTRIIRAFGHSVDGLRSAFLSEPAFRQDLILAMVLVPIALWLDVSAASKALMVASLVLVLIAELANTGIEAAIDRISEDQHELSKKAKDVGSAMVFLALVNAGAIWGIILFDL